MNIWSRTTYRSPEAAPSTIANLIDSIKPAERRTYSIVRAIRALAGEGEAGLEQEVSDHIASRLGATRQTNSIFIPTRGFPDFYATALDTKTDAAGKFTVQTEVRDLIELLVNKTRVIQIGATVLSGLAGNVTFPTHDTMGTGEWIGENPGSDVTDVHSTFGQRSMVPHTFQASTAYSRQLLAQSSVDIEGFVRDDLATRHAQEIDRAAINGSGNAAEPLGILGTSNVGSVVIGGTGSPTYDSMVELESELADANADADTMKFLTTPGMRGRMRKTVVLNNAAGFPLWEQVSGSPGVGNVIGYPAYVSKQVPSTLTSGSNSDCHAIIFGYWPSLYIGEWGVLELIVDPLRLKKQGMIEITSFQMVDFMLRHPEQFAAIQDARDVAAA